MLQSIDEYAFYSCSSLSSITIPSGVTSIGSYVFSYCYSLSEITIPNSVTSIGNYAFRSCYSLSNITIPSGVTSIGNYAFSDCSSLSNITIPSGVTSIGNYAFSDCSSLSEITCLAETAPTVSSNTFTNISSLGVLYYLGLNSSYDAWKQYLPNWDFVSLYTPQECTNLVITAEDVNGRQTTTTISYTATTNGINSITNEQVSGIELIGTTISEPFEQNTDTENEVIRIITFEYMGVTAETTITQGVWKNQSYSVNLNNQWQLSTDYTNFDSTTYDGIYESFSNKGVNSSSATCIVTIVGYTNFTLYIGSYAESSYDYTIAFDIDSTSTQKVTTSSFQYAPTSIDKFKKVEYTNLDGGEHTITIVYRKDSSGNSGNDKGYLIIPKNQ